MRALITGITGQDGSYLAEHLLERGYEVHGLVRRVALEDPQRRFQRIKHILNDVVLHAATIEDFPSVYRVFANHSFQECYHLAAQSFVAESFTDGFSTLSTNINGTHFVLAALQETQPECRFYFAGSSEMFGKVSQSPQNERTRFYPRSPYGVSKMTGYWLTVNYREAYGLFACNGVLFNHESPRRGFEFVTRKITSAVAAIKLGRAKELRLGNLEARRDWGHARDYVRAMHAMLRQDRPGDFVIGTGRTHSVRDFCELAFSEVGLDYRSFVVVDDRFLRPAEEETLCADAGKARRELSWEPTISLDDLVREMVREDLRVASAVEDQEIPNPLKGRSSDPI